MNSHLLTQEERDYFINLYKEKMKIDYFHDLNDIFFRLRYT